MRSTPKRPPQRALTPMPREVVARVGGTRLSMTIEVSEAGEVSVKTRREPVERPCSK